MPMLDFYTDKMRKINAEQETMAETCDSEKRDFTPDEKEHYDSLSADWEDFHGKREAEEKRIARGLPANPRKRITPDPNSGIKVETRDDNRAPTFQYMDTSGHEHRCLRFDEAIPRNDLGDEQYAVDAGKVLRAMTLNQTADLNEYEKRSMIGGSDTAGGFLLDSPVASQVIDLARANSVVMKAGAQTLPMTTSELSLAKVTADPTSHWRAEGVAVASSNVTLGRVTLKPKTLACIVPVSIELIEDAPNASALLLETITASMAATLDAALLAGAGGGSSDGIVGVRNYPGVLDNSTGGVPADYTIPSNVIAALLNANCPTPLDQLTWIRHPSVAALYDQLVATAGETVQPSPWVSQVKSLHTTALPSTEGGGAEHVEILGDFSQVVVGLRTSGMQVEILREGSVSDGTTTFNATSQLLRHIRVYLRADMIIQQPTWLSLMSEVDLS